MSINTTDNITIVSHPVIARDLTILRDKNTTIHEFRRAMRRAGTILVYHALNDLKLRSFQIETPMKETTGYDIEKEIMVIPILRAGLGLTDAVIEFIPDATVGHLGMYRDEDTLQPVDYYSNIPDSVSEATVLVVDPMLATGGSAHDALTHLKQQGAENLRFISLISAPEGVQRLRENHPDVPITTAAVDEKLDENAFIVPGLGDAGDRFFGTE